MTLTLTSKIVYNHNITSIHCQNRVYLGIKIHKWPYIKSYEDKCKFMTVEFETEFEAEFIEQDLNLPITINIHDAVGRIWKQFEIKNCKLFARNKSIVQFEVDFWAETNII